jgi:hypothetical protein
MACSPLTYYLFKLLGCIPRYVSASLSVYLVVDFFLFSFSFTTLPPYFTFGSCRWHLSLSPALSLFRSLSASLRIDIFLRLSPSFPPRLSDLSPHWSLSLAELRRGKKGR